MQIHDLFEGWVGITRRLLPLACKFLDFFKIFEGNSFGIRLNIQLWNWGSILDVVSFLLITIDTYTLKIGGDE
jgi:hypothetical protein